MNESRIYIVSGDESGLRLDHFLTIKEETLSRSFIQKLIKEESITVNDKPSKPSHKLRDNDRVEIIVPEPKPAHAQPENIPLNVLYEDGAIIVINKPAGMVTHPAAGNYAGTLVNAILAHCPDLSGIGGVQRPGIVHRLDKDTSGVLVVAKTDWAHQSLAVQFKEHRVKKIYLALICGIPAQDNGTIIAPIGRSIRNRQKMAVTNLRAREAITHFKAIERYDGFSFVEVIPETGRTHQIRVHLAHIGHPVVGDQVYGGGYKRAINEAHSPKLKQMIAELNRQALHAHLLGFRHPSTEEYVEFTAPIPGDIRVVLDVLRSQSSQ
ncbi:RluA family pseudouridine synthase [Candidatus Poribacteria bacterium]|nr:RluA family pseudouridine synthase [Candidatus Poribacteria bacterium]